MDWYHVAKNVNNPFATEWVQIGKFQGSVGVLDSPSGVKLYYEYQTCEGDPSGYHTKNLGAPSAVNSKVAVDRFGTSKIVCGNGDTAWPYAFRIGSVTASPVGTGYINVSSAVGEAKLEVYDGTGSIRQSVSRTEFGLTNSHTPSSTYGLHLQNSSGWTLWTTANTFCSRDAPLDYVLDRRWDAFHADDNVSNTC